MTDLPERIWAMPGVAENGNVFWEWGLAYDNPEFWDDDDRAEMGEPQEYIHIDAYNAAISETHEQGRIAGLREAAEAIEPHRNADVKTGGVLHVAQQTILARAEQEKE